MIILTVLIPTIPERVDMFTKLFNHGDHSESSKKTQHELQSELRTGSNN